MSSRVKGCTQVAAAAKSGMSDRSGRRIEQSKGKRKKATRHWRTRKDPLSAVWEQELEPLLHAKPALSPMTLLEHLQGREDGHCYPDSLLRTLQRRVKQWQSLHGPDKAVIFRQTHPPGLQGLSDFTTLKRVSIEIKGKAFTHLLYHFRLAYSGWSHLKVIVGGESFTALAEGLQEALWRLGGAPKTHRTDSLSAAYKNLSVSDQADMTQRYEGLCDHYGMKATRNNRGVSHENGSIEASHGHLKRRIEQGLLLRGSHDFSSMEAYQQWLDGLVNQHNRRNAKTVQVEKAALLSLPLTKTTDFTEVCSKVSSSSTIEVRRATYTVPSRLMGEHLRIHLYHDRLACYVGMHPVCTLKRVYSTKAKRARQIDYRHLIGALVKKPQAFRYSQIREDLLPSEVWQDIWKWIDAHHSPKVACRLIVGLLHLAATTDREAVLGEQLCEAIEQDKPLVLSEWSRRYLPSFSQPPTIAVSQHPLAQYDVFVSSTSQEVTHGQ
jgi:transposase InsO family protein